MKEGLTCNISRTASTDNTTFSENLLLPTNSNEGLPTVTTVLEIYLTRNGHFTIIKQIPLLPSNFGRLSQLTAYGTEAETGSYQLYPSHEQKKYKGM